MSATVTNDRTVCGSEQQAAWVARYAQSKLKIAVRVEGLFIYHESLSEEMAAKLQGFAHGVAFASAAIEGRSQ